MDEDKYDDLGVRNGNQFDDYGGHARQAVKLWVPTAVGQRPIDWAKRDLVYGRSRNDGRNWQQRSLLKNKPPFLFAGVQHNTRDRDVIANLRTIQYLLYLKLYRLIDEQVHFSLKEKFKSILLSANNRLQDAGINNYDRIGVGYLDASKSLRCYSICVLERNHHVVIAIVRENMIGGY